MLKENSTSAIQALETNDGLPVYVLSWIVVLLQ
jgi:hypothetical protein